MSKPEVWTLEKLQSEYLGNTVVWTFPLLKYKVNTALPYPVVSDAPEFYVDTVIVVGGGVLIDTVKVWRKDKAPGTKLIAIPSVWGSGAENSAIAVLNIDNKKVIHKGNEYLPDVRIIWSDLAESLSESIKLHACGDVWAHAIEAFLSPIATDDIRKELAELLIGMSKLSLANVAEWFEYSALSCSLQARASVGLIHGIAHVLEGQLKAVYPQSGFGHARLCGLYLWPIFDLNLRLTGKVDMLLSKYRLNKVALSEIFKGFHDKESYELTLPVLEKCWNLVLKEGPTRTNCVFVRPNHLSYFTKGIIE
jgi:alcohol dehydrogenase class IV